MTHAATPWKGPSPAGGQKLVSRVLRHLFRRTALLAALLGLSAGVVAAVIGPDTGVGQVLLVLAGIAASVVVLPEEPHRLWDVNAEDLAATVPSPNLLFASQSIAQAIAMQDGGPVPPLVVDSLWTDTLDGLGTVVGDPSRVVLDLDYGIRVTPERAGPPTVVTSIDARRCIPKAQDGTVWFSFCADPEALRGEFQQHSNGCLSRELIDRRHDETSSEWADRVEGYRVDLTINGEHIERQDPYRVASSHGTEADESDGAECRVVRVPFDAGPLTERFVPTHLVVEFHADPAQRRFPVKFAAYYVVGATCITIEVMDPEAVVELDEYISSASRPVTIGAADGLTARGFHIVAAEGTVLPPGSGAVLTWENAVVPDVG